jgi:hypothetical protein
MLYSDKGKTVMLSTTGVPPVRTESVKVGVLFGDIARLRSRAGTALKHFSSAVASVLLHPVVLVMEVQDEPSSVAMRPG